MKTIITWITALILSVAMAAPAGAVKQTKPETVDPENVLNRHAVWMKWFRGDRDVIDKDDYAETLVKQGASKSENDLEKRQAEGGRTSAQVEEEDSA
ncbi:MULTISPECIES: hypothetical protein [unclassified Nitrospina]|uniref:hypothetical protein n=1 Tax=unclassified Nitrospina TaxID=2638683 RepID=UPI003F973F81